MAGDVFDSPNPDPFSSAKLRDFAEQLAQVEIDLLIATGNHDRHPLVLGLPKEITRVESIHSSINSWQFHGAGSLITVPGLNRDVRIVMFNWMPSSKIAAALQTLPTSLDILIMHQSCSGFLPAVATCEMEIESLSGTARYVALGDLHISKELMPSAETIVAYPGSTEMVSTGEPMAKSVNIVTLDLDSNALPVITKAPLTVRDIVKLTVATPEDLQELREWDPVDQANSLFVLKYDSVFGREAKTILHSLIASGKIYGCIEQSIPKNTGVDTFSVNKEMSGAEMSDLIMEHFSDNAELVKIAGDLWKNPDNSKEILKDL